MEKKLYAHTCSYSVCVCLLYMRVRFPGGDVMGEQAMFGSNTLTCMWSQWAWTSRWPLFQ